MSKGGHLSLRGLLKARRREPDSGSFAAAKYLAALQDRKSRYLWMHPLETKNAYEVTRAYKQMFEQAREGCRGASGAEGRPGGRLQKHGVPGHALWRPRACNRRQNSGNTTQVDSTIGRWREAERWFDFILTATEALNNKDLRPLRGATPAQALKDYENQLLRFTQSEKDFDDLQRSQR